jgi:ParB family transcriptional regulator, chromosome partitioning protein
MTHLQIAEMVGKSRASISNLLRLLELPEDIKQLLEQGQLEMGHARTLITLPNSIQLEAANLIVAQGLSVRETEKLVRRLQHPNERDKQVLRWQDLLSKQWKLRVAIQCNAKGRGKLVIHYRNLSELDTLLNQLG